MIKNTLPNMSGNPEGSKTNHSSWKALQIIRTLLARVC